MPKSDVFPTQLPLFHHVRWNKSVVGLLELKIYFYFKMKLFKFHYVIELMQHNLEDG